jgi:hypothetical protein
MQAQQQRFSAGEAAILFAGDMLLKSNALRLCVTSTGPTQPASEVSERQRLPFAFGHACSPQESPQPGPASQQSGAPFAPPQCPPWLRLAEATRVIAPKPLMVPLLAQKAGFDDKVKVFVLHVEPIITDMTGRSLKADAH